MLLLVVPLLHSSFIAPRPSSLLLLLLIIARTLVILVRVRVEDGLVVGFSAQYLALTQPRVLGAATATATFQPVDK